MGYVLISVIIRYFRSLSASTESRVTRIVTRSGEMGAVFAEAVFALPVLAMFIFGSIQAGMALEEKAVLEEIARVTAQTALRAGGVTNGIALPGLLPGIEMSDLGAFAEARIDDANYRSSDYTVTICYDAPMVDVTIKRNVASGLYILAAPAASNRSLVPVAVGVPAC